MLRLPKIFYPIILSLLFAISFTTACTSPIKQEKDIANAYTESGDLSVIEKSGFQFYILSDWGFNGHYQQRDVAATMAFTAEKLSPKMIVSCGDNFQVNGVQGTSDPLWMTNFETIYDHPSLLVDWHPVLGNHDYKGNTRALIDYSNISRRWRMTNNYYTVTKTIDDSTSALFVFIDTPALMSYYWERAAEYPDVVKQDSAQQIKWLHKVLATHKHDWVFVFGHHPIFSDGARHGDTPELIAKLKPIFDQYQVDFYFSGHDHDFQHLNPDSSHVNYFVTGTGGRIRENKSEGKALVAISKPGFTLASVNHSHVNIHFISSERKVLYSYNKKAKKNESEQYD